MSNSTARSLTLYLLWIIHFTIIGSMAWTGYFLGTWLVTFLQTPINASDISAEWWQIFARFAAVISFGLFLGVFLGYVFLIRPGQINT